MLRHRPAKEGEHRWEYWQLRISISNTDQRLLDWIQERFPGHRAELRNGRPNQKNAFHWYAESKKAEPILRAVLPYLVLKRRQADIALEYIATHKLVGRRGHPPETVALRRRLAAEMKRLNHRGESIQIT